MNCATLVDVVSGNSLVFDHLDGRWLSRFFIVLNPITMS